MERIFNVKVVSVNTIVAKGKVPGSRRGHVSGRCSDFKKAIVKLEEGNKIDFGVGV